MMELTPKDWIDLLLTLTLAGFGAGKIIGWLTAKSEVTATYPADDWRRGIEGRLAAGNDKFAAIETRFESAGELISKLATRVQGMQTAIEDRIDAKYVTKESLTHLLQGWDRRTAESDRRFAAVEQIIRNNRGDDS